MIISIILFASLGTLGFKPATSASINYEPIKITVNKNYYAQPDFEGQAEYIYTNPYNNLQPGYVPSNIEALISSIKQKTKSCSKETSEFVEEEVSEILKPLADPFADFTKETLSGIIGRKKTITKTIKQLEDLLKEIEAIPEEDSKSFKEVKSPNIIGKTLELLLPQPPLSSPIIIKDGPYPDPIYPELSVAIETPNILPEGPRDNEKPALLEECIEISDPIQEISTLHLPETSLKFEDFLPSPPSLSIPIKTNGEPNPISSQVVIIPEAPFLPPLSLDMIPSLAAMIKIEEPILSEKSAVSPPIQEISGVLSSEINFEPNDLLLPPPSLSIPIKINQEPQPFTLTNKIIPEAPVLPPLSLDMIPFMAQNKKIEEPVLLEESGVSHPIQEISTSLFPETCLEPEDLLPSPPSLTLPIKTHSEPNPVTSEVLIIPEAPVLPPLSPDMIPSIAAMMKIEKPILSEKSEVSPPIQEISGVLSSEISLEPNDSLLPQPSLSIPIKINQEPHHFTLANKIIPEAPVLPPLSLNMIPSMAQNMKTEEPVLLEESGVSNSIQEVSTFLMPETCLESEDLLPSPPSLSLPIKMNDEPNPITSEVLIIPESPVLPPLSPDIIPSIAAMMKIEEPMLLEKSAVSPLIQEISGVLSSEISFEPNDLLLPPPSLSIPIKINQEPQPFTLANKIIPEARVLPPLSLDMIPFMAQNKKIEEPVLLEESGVSHSIQEISTFLLPETCLEPEDLLPSPHSLSLPIKTNGEPKPITSEVLIIPEAPVLPPLSPDMIPSIAGMMKYEEPILSEKTRVSPPIKDISGVLSPEISLEPNDLLLPPTYLSIPIKINHEPQPVTLANEIIPEAPVLPPLSLDMIPFMAQNMKIEEPVLLEESGVSHPIQEISTSLLPEPSLESEELLLPPPSLLTPIKMDDVPKPVTTKHEIIPEAPVLPPLSRDMIPFITEKLTIEDPVPLEESAVSHPIQEFSTVLLSEASLEPEELTSQPPSLPVPIKIIDEPNLVTQNVVTISGASVLPTLSVNPFVTEETKIKEPVLFGESRESKKFTNIPYLSHLSTRLPKSKANENMITKLTSLKPYLMQRMNTNQRFRLPQMFSISPNNIFTTINQKSEKNNRFQLYTSCAQDIIEKRIAPYFAFKKRTLNSKNKYLPIKRFQINKLHL